MTVNLTNRHQGMVGRLGNVSVNTLAPRGRPEKQSHGWEPVTLSRLVVVDTTMITNVIRKIRFRGSRIECAKAHAIPGPSNQTSKARCKSIDMLAHPAEQGKQSHGWYHVTLQGLGMTVATVITSTKIKKDQPKGRERVSAHSSRERGAEREREYAHASHPTREWESPRKRRDSPEPTRGRRHGDDPFDSRDEWEPEKKGKIKKNIATGATLVKRMTVMIMMIVRTISPTYHMVQRGSMVSHFVGRRKEITGGLITLRRRALSHRWSNFRYLPEKQANGRPFATRSKSLSTKRSVQTLNGCCT